MRSCLILLVVPVIFLIKNVCGQQDEINLESYRFANFKSDLITHRENISKVRNRFGELNHPIKEKEDSKTFFRKSDIEPIELTNSKPVETFKVSEHGISLGNHLFLNGYFHARFHSVDHEQPSNSWFQAFDDYFLQNNYFYVVSELYLKLEVEKFSLNTRFHLTESGINTKEIYGQFDFDETSRLKIGKIESNRAHSSLDLSQRIILSRDYHYMEGGFGSSFSYALNDIFWRKMTEPLYKMLSTSAQAIDGDIDYKAVQDEFDASMKEYSALFGITDEDRKAFADLDTFTHLLKNPAKLEQELNKLMAKISDSILDLMKTSSILVSNYRVNYTKGIMFEKDLDAISLYLAFRDSVWSTMSNLDEGQFGLDLGASIKLNPHLTWVTHYAFEKFDAPGGMMNFFIPDASDNLHNLNSFIKYQNERFTLSVEGGYFSLNPIDTDAWLAMMLMQYRFQNGFALAFRYSHEDLSTPFGDGRSNSWTLSPSYRIKDYLLIRTELGTSQASLGTVSDDINYFFTIETLAEF
jgi:hypothetical protein